MCLEQLRSTAILTEVQHEATQFVFASLPEYAHIIVFLGSLFSREFAGFTGLVFKAIRGREGFTRAFGSKFSTRYEDPSCEAHIADVN
jgi:hypothetical protein